MIILGIDPGFGRLGYAIIEKDKNSSQIKIIDCSCVETNAKSTYYERFFIIADKIKKLISKYNPEIIALEKIFFAQNQKTALQIAEVRGMLIYLALSSNINIFEFTPLEVKMALCGYGKASKNQVAKMLKMVLGIKALPKPDDATDAMAIGLTCAVSMSPKWPKN